MLDRVIAVVLVLNLTNLFMILPGCTGIGLRAISTVMMLLCTVYVAVHWRTVVRLFDTGSVYVLLLLHLLFWPMAVALWADWSEATLVSLGLAYNACILCLAASIYCLHHAPEHYDRILSASLVIACAGVVVSLFFQEELVSLRGVVEDMEEPANARGTGFYFQPNTAAHNLCFLLAGVLPALSRLSHPRQLLCLFAFLGIIGLTGSRGGAIVACLLVLVWMVLVMRQRNTVLLLLYATAATTVLLLPSDVWLPETAATSDGPAQRIVQSIRRVMQGERISDDGSIQDRLEAQTQYLAACRARPLGHGAGASTLHQSQGKFRHTTHAYYLATAYDYGLPGLLLYCWLLFQCCKLLRREPLGVLLLLPVVVSGAFFAAVFSARVLPVILGGHLGTARRDGIACPVETIVWRNQRDRGSGFALTTSGTFDIR